MSMKINEFVSSLFEIEVNTHIAHLQTRSYSQHKALNDLYEEIVDLRDRFIESYQGKNPIITGYRISCSDGMDIINYIKDCERNFCKFRETLSEGYQQQICDDIIELLSSTLYKLTKLTEA